MPSSDLHNDWSARMPCSSPSRFRGYSRQYRQMRAPACAEAKALRPFFSGCLAEDGDQVNSLKKLFECPTDQTSRCFALRKYRFAPETRSDIDGLETARSVRSRPIAARSDFGSQCRPNETLAAKGEISPVQKFNGVEIPLVDRLEPAKFGRSLEQFARADCGSETGRWANTHLTSVDPKATFAAFSSAVGFQERGYKEGPIPPVCLFRLDSVQRPAKSLRAREGGRPKTRLNAWENDGVSANPTAAAISAIPRRLYRKRVRARSRRRWV